MPNVSWPSIQEAQSPSKIGPKDVLMGYDSSCMSSQIVCILPLIWFDSDNRIQVIYPEDNQASVYI